MANVQNVRKIVQDVSQNQIYVLNTLYKKPDKLEQKTYMIANPTTRQIYICINYLYILSIIRDREFNLFIGN